MNKPIFSLIAVVAKDRGIGNNNELLFHIPEDLKYFQNVTSGHTVIMGKNTYFSLPNGALPGRKNIVLSRQELSLKDAQVFDSLTKAVESCSGEQEVFVIGGASIYQQAISLADKLYITEVDAIKPADTFFPDYSSFNTIKELGDGEYKGLKYKFLELTKG
ncbi:MAG: Dihydrofolate reductase [bacterium ADurb.Bin212]|nr:MAG: Dihydrofolate reductase [bacterium ADurb.Bin212]